MDSSKIARFQARKALEDPKAFVNYTPEQIARAKAEIEADPSLRKKKQKSELKQGFFKSIWNLFKDRREYKQAMLQDKDESKLVTRQLTEAEIKQAEKDKEIIQRTVKIINNEAEKYSENMEVAANVLINGTPILGTGVGIGTSWLLNKFGFFEKMINKALDKNASEETKRLFNEFKEVKKINPLYWGRFGKFMLSLSEDLSEQVDLKVGKKAGEKASKEFKMNSKNIKTILKASMAHKWVRGGVLGGVTGLITGTVGALIGLKLQKSAARAGRYTAKRELEKDPRNFIGYTQEEYNEVQDIKADKKGESKFKQYALFIPRVIKQYLEYEKYRKGKFKEEQLIQAQLQKMDVTDEQLRDAKNLQRKLFNTFEKVDDNSQIYSESMEAAVEIAQPFVSYGGMAALFSPAIFIIIQAARGKMTPAQVISKITGFASKISKGGNTKLMKNYLESVNKNVSTKVQGQYVDKKPLGFMLKDINIAEDPIYKIITQSWVNMKASTKELNKLTNEELNEQIWSLRFSLDSLMNNINDYASLLTSESKISSIKFMKKIDNILHGITKLPKETKIDALDILLNPQVLKEMPKERYNRAFSELEKIINKAKNNIGSYFEENGKVLEEALNKNQTKITKKVGHDKFYDILHCIENSKYLSEESIQRAIETLSNPKILAILRKEMPKEEFAKLVYSINISKPFRLQIVDLIKQLPSEKVESLLRDNKLQVVLKEILSPEKFNLLEQYTVKAKANPKALVDEILDYDTIIKLNKYFEKNPEKKVSIFDRHLKDILPEGLLPSIGKITTEYNIGIKKFSISFVQENKEMLLKYITKEELYSLMKYFDTVLKDPEKALADKSLKEVGQKVLNKLEVIAKSNPDAELNNIKINQKIIDLAKKLKMELKPNKDGKYSAVDILKETIALPSKAKTYTFRDIFNLVPQRMKDPKTMINGLKEKFSKMTDAEFAQFMEGKMESMDKKTMLKIIGDFETIINNVPKDEINKIWNTMLKEFSEHPDEFVKLMQRGGIKQILLTPGLKKALIVAGISYPTFILIATYAIESWLAEMQLKAGRLGVMKSLEDLDDIRYYANVV